jgi:hypothetical protein
VLRSVLIALGSASRPLRICHKLCSDVKASDRCFFLSFWIVYLGFGDDERYINKKYIPVTSIRHEQDIEDLDARRKKFIGPSLAYACGYRAKHLQPSTGTIDDAGMAVKLVDLFFNRHFLSWLEVLGIEADLRAAIYSFHDARSLLTTMCRDLRT